MPFYFPSLPSIPTQADSHNVAGLPTRGERLVTVAATALGVLVVALIAVLMGMA